MTHITLPRAIVEQVRQALTVLLDHLDGVPADQVALADWIQAEADLCSALAQQAERVEEQSIVEKFNAAFSRHAATRGDAVLIERRDGRLYMNDSEIGPGTLEIREDGVTYRSAALVDVRKPEQAEPVELVAWAYMGIKQDGTEHGPHLVWKPEYMDAMSASKGAKAIPLYTAPPQRKPLTDEEIAAEWQKASECAGNSEAAVTASQFVQMFARAIERAHGVKE